MAHQGKHIITPPISPLKDDGTLDVEAYNELLMLLKKLGLNKILVSSLYSEANLMNDKEYELLLRYSIDNARKFDFVAFSPRGLSLELMVKDLILGVELGYRVAFVPILLEFATTDVHTYRFYDFITRRVDIDIIISVNDPNIQLSVNALEGLVNDIPQIKGIAVSSTDIGYLLELLWRLKHEIRGNIMLLTNLDEVFPLALLMGFDGGIVLSSQVINRHFLDLVKYFEKGDLVNYLKAFADIMVFLRLFREAYSRIGVIKLALYLLHNWLRPILKQPYPSEHSYLYSEVKHILTTLGYIKEEG